MSGQVMGPYINHPIVIVQNVVMTVVFSMMGLIFCISDMGAEKVGLFILIIAVVAAVFCIMFWKTTTIEFGENEFVVRRNFIVRKEKVVPYSRVAAVNVTRTVFDRIAGTETLSFNVNSAVNSARPEAAFCFERARADGVRNYVYARMFGGTQRAEPLDVREHESLVSFGPGRVILHSLLSQRTWQLAWSGVFIAFAVISLAFDSAGGLLFGLLMFAFQSGFPFIAAIIRYYGFRMYRDGDTICLQYGAFHNYRSEFEASKINAIRLRRPFLARLAGMSCLEAEVVGIDATSTAVPMLCLLMPDAEAEALIARALPEFDCEIPEVSPPREAWKAMLCQATVFDAVLIAVMIVPCILALDYEYSEDLLVQNCIRYAPSVCTVLLALYAFWRGWRSYILRSIGLGDDKMVMRNGLLDREWVMIQYDRIQITKLSGDMISRHFGVCHCSVHLLSTSGARRITSGYFPIGFLEQVPRTVQDRIRDGRYDPARNRIY